MTGSMIIGVTRRSLPLAALALIVSGCATNPDPHEGGFFSGVQGITSGSYAKRQRSQEAELDRLKQQQGDAEQRAAASRAAVAEREARVASLKRKVATLDGQIAGQQARVAKLSTGSAAAAVRNRQRTAELAALRRQVASLKGQLRLGIDPAEYDSVRAEYLNVQNAIAAISADVSRERRP